jgi:hypothetical protein
MLEGAPTARLKESSAAIIPGNTIMKGFIVMPPYCSARSRYPIFWRYRNRRATAQLSRMEKTDDNPAA